MRLIMLLNEHAAQTVREEGAVCWLEQNNVTPVLMVVKQDGNTVREVLDIPDEVYHSLWTASASNQRGTTSSASESPCHNGVRLLSTGLRAMVNDRCIELNRKEYELLRFLMQNRGQVFTKEQLYRQIWNKPALKNKIYTVVVHMNRLRKKIEENPSEPKILQTIRGIGYCFGSPE